MSKERTSLLKFILFIGAVIAPILFGHLMLRVIYDVVTALASINDICRILS
jgi:hypothetical protein